MAAPGLPPLPPQLKAIQHYLRTAQELDKREPVVAYYCKWEALMGRRAPPTSNFCVPPPFPPPLVSLVRGTRRGRWRELNSPQHSLFRAHARIALLPPPPSLAQDAFVAWGVGEKRENWGGIEQGESARTVLIKIQSQLRPPFLA